MDDTHVNQHRRIWATTRAVFEADSFKHRKFGERRLRHWSLFERSIQIFGGLLKLTRLYDRGRRNADRIVVNRIDLPFADLPEAFHGYTLLHMTDLHVDFMPGIDSTSAATPTAVRSACPVGNPSSFICVTGVGFTADCGGTETWRDIPGRAPAPSAFHCGSIRSAKSPCFAWCGRGVDGATAVPWPGRRPNALWASGFRYRWPTPRLERKRSRCRVREIARLREWRTAPTRRHPR
jgi:hypothetical protein